MPIGAAMQADVKIAGALERSPVLRGIGCMLCGRQDVSARDIAKAIAGGPPALCGRCRRSVRPSALDTVLDALGMTAAAFADATGLPLRTVVRAAKGERLSKRSAMELARLTGLPWQTWRAST